MFLALWEELRKLKVNIFLYGVFFAEVECDS
jgi:hypothetical protein